MASDKVKTFTDANYIASLAEDSTLTQISALCLHYGNLLIALGTLAAPGLVRGARGLRLVVAGSLATALGFANVSGMILADWWNYSTGTHLSSEQAVEIFRAWHPDVVLLDLVLPDVDGIELLRQLMAINPSPEMIVISQAAPTAWIRPPKLEAKLANQIARKVGLRSGASDAPLPSCAMSMGIPGGSGNDIYPLRRSRRSRAE